MFQARGPRKRLRFRALHGKTLAFQECMAIVLANWGFLSGSGLEFGSLEFNKSRAFCVYVVDPRLGSDLRSVPFEHSP